MKKITTTKTTNKTVFITRDPINTDSNNKVLKKPRETTKKNTEKLELTTAAVTPQKGLSKKTKGNVNNKGKKVQRDKVMKSPLKGGIKKNKKQKIPNTKITKPPLKGGGVIKKNKEKK